MSCSSAAINLVANEPVYVEPKDPDAVVDYPMTLETWFLNRAPGDALSTAEGEVEPPGELTVTQVTVSGVTLRPWLSGGVEDKEYTVKISWTTSEGRSDSRSFKVQVRRRWAQVAASST